MHGYWMEDSLGKYGVDADRLRPVPHARQAATSTASRAASTAAATATLLPAAADSRATGTSAPTAAPRGGPRSAEPRRLARLRQRLLRHRRPGRVVHVAGVRRDDVDRPRRRSPTRSGRQAPTTARPERRRQPVPNWADHALRRRGRRGRGGEPSGRTPAAAPRPRPRAPGMGVYAHEFSHLSSLRTTTTTRSPTTSGTSPACWDMMSRGTFNGPGGPHTRWQIPPPRAARASARTTCSHFKNQLGVLAAADQVTRRARHAAEPGHRGRRGARRASAIPNGDLVGLTVDFARAGRRPGRHVR